MNTLYTQILKLKNIQFSLAIGTKNSITGFWKSKIILLCMGILFCGSVNQLSAQATYKYFLPIPEQQLNTNFKTIYTGTGNVMTSVTSIVIGTDGTLIYYDNWEDGYEANPVSPAQSTTQIWGDNNPANGIPPGFASDVLNAGSIITLRNDINLPRNPTVVLYDGRDKLVSNQSITITKAGWALTPGTVLASCVEVYDASLFSKNFITPVGETTPNSNGIFGLSSLLVMASENGTQIQIDANADGTYETVQTINQGESYMVSAAAAGDVLQGAKVLADKPVQVNMITGKIGSTYESRTFAGYATELWGNHYYNPICQTNSSVDVYVFLYNPAASAITIKWTSTSSSGSFSVPANSSYRYIMPLNSGVYFYTDNASDKFFGVGASDADAANNQTYDYGFSLLPESYLTTSIINGWGPGSSTVPPLVNGSPVWIMSVMPTTVYVDYDNNSETGPLVDPNGNKYDVSYNLTPYQSLRVFDPNDNDQTGLHAYTLDGYKIMAVWGEDPSTAGPANPYLDMGTTILPDRDIELIKTAKITTDGGTIGVVDPGDVVTYYISLRNLTLRVKEVATLTDVIPTGFTYNSGTTVWDGYTIPDNTSPATAFPLDESGFFIGLLGANAITNLEFKVTAQPLIANYTSVTNIVTVTSNLGEVWTAKKSLPVNTGSGITACSIDFVNVSGTSVGVYQPDQQVCVQITDNDKNTNPSTSQSLSVNVINSSQSDQEIVILTETGLNTGVFRGCLNASSAGGQGNQNGTLYGVAGDLLTVNYIDPIYTDACSDVISIAAPTFSKPLYLSDALLLDRIDPVASADATTVTSTTISAGTATITTVQTLPVTAVTSSNANSRTISIDPGTGSNRLLLVGVAVGQTAQQNNGTPPTISSVTFGSTAMTLVGTRISSDASGDNNDVRVYIYSLVNPASGSANVTITLSAAGSISAHAVAFTGVNQTTPLGSFQSSSYFTVGNVLWVGNATESLTVTTNTGELVYSIIAHDESANPITVGTNQTKVINSSNLNYLGTIASIKNATGNSTNVSYVNSGSSGLLNDQDWALAAVSIKPVSLAAGGATFTETTALCSGLVLPVSGEVGATMYVNTTSGTMPSNPTITATLKHNGTTFATLSNPTYTTISGSRGYLDWSSTMGSAVNIPTGEKISVDVNSTQSGVGFQILYDSQTNPSHIHVPSSAVITLDNLEFRDAAYPGGNILSGALTGQTVYVRATASDPFGYDDITAMQFAFTDPSSAVINQVPTLVNSIGCNRTYEFVWTVPNTTGNYSIEATAKEGTENTITAKKVKSINVGFQDLGSQCSLKFINAGGVQQTSYTPSSQICVQNSDADKNKNSTVTETITVVLSASPGGDSEVLTLTETGANTGIFRACINSSSTVNTIGVLYAPVGAILSAVYTDPDDATDVCHENAFITSPVPAVSIVKTIVTPASGVIQVGGAIQFSIIVTNPGATTLNTVNLTDTYNASYLQFVGASISPTTSGSGTINWSNIGPIASGASKTVLIDFIALSTVNPTINSASVGAIDQNSVSVNGGPSTANVIIINPSLSISKTVTSPLGNAYLGGTVSFQIVLTNTGNTIITSLPLSDQFSSGCLSLINASITPDANSGGVLLWNNVGPLNPGASLTITTNFEVIGSCTPVNNGADVTFATDEYGYPVPPVSTTVSKVIQLAPIAVDDIAYTTANTAVIINVPSNDSDPNNNINLTSVSNSGLLAPSHGSISINPTSGAITYTPALNYLGFDEFDYKICDNTSPTPLCSTAHVTVYINCAGSVGTNIINGTVFNDLNFDGLKAPSETGTSGISVQLWRDVNFNGSRDGLDVLVNTVSTSANGDYSFNVSSIASYPSQYLVITTTGYPSNTVLTTDNIEITKFLAIGTSDCNKNFGYAPGADLSLLKGVSPASVCKDETAIFKLDLTNSGPAAATNVKVKDILPTGLIFLSNSGSGSYDSGTGVWNVGTINSGQTLTLNITVLANISGVYLNTAEVFTSDQYDIDSKVNNGDPLEDDQNDAELIVWDTPSISSPPSAVAKSYCLNGVATPLSVTASAGSGTIVNYEWFKNTLPSNSGGISIVVHSNSSTTDSYTPLTTAAGKLYYYVVVSNSNGCKLTSSISGEITVNTSPTLSLAVSDASVCNPASGNATITVTNAQNGYLYELRSSLGTSLSPTVSATGSGVDLSLTVLHANTPTSTTTYKVYASINGCPATALTDQPTITVNLPPTPVITGSSAACSGATGSVYSTPNISGHTYLWTVVGGTISAGSGTYSITITWGATGTGTVNVTETITDTGCSATATQKSVTINSLPTFTTTFSDATCFGTSTGWIQVNVTGGSSPYTYSMNNGSTYNTTGTPYTFNSLPAGVYKIRIKDSNGCESVVCP